MPTMPNSSHRATWEKKVKGKYSDDLWPNPYNNWKWKKYSKRYRAQRLMCERCEEPYRTTELVTDHIYPIKQGGAFWDSRNHQAMCVSCHSKKRNEERQGKLVPFKYNSNNEKIPDTSNDTGEGR